MPQLLQSDVLPSDAPEEGEESPEPGRSFFDRFKVRPGSIGGCAFNLCSATLGAGSLSLPYAFRCSGMVLALILLFLGALSTIFSIFLLLEARRLTGKQSYEDLANYLYGKRFQKLVEFAIIIFCFGTAAAYIIAIGDILEPVAEAISAPGWLNRNLLMALFWLCVMLPLSMVEKVNSLTWTSLMGILSISFLVIAASAHAIQTIDRDGWRTDETTYFASDLPLLLGAPIVMFAFTCQVNVFSIQNELKNPTPERMSRVVLTSVSISMTVYALMGLAGYLDFLGETPGNILKKYELQADGFVDILIDLAFLAITITVVVAFPLNIFPCRFAFEYLVFGDSPAASGLAAKQQSHEDAGVSLTAEDLGLLREQIHLNDLSPEARDHSKTSSIQDEELLVVDPFQSNYSDELLISGGRSSNDTTSSSSSPHRRDGFLRGKFMRHFGLTFILCGGALAVAIALPSLNFAFQMLGGVCSSFLCFALPAMYVIKIAHEPRKFVHPELLPEFPGAYRDLDASSGVDHYHHRHQKSSKEYGLLSSLDGDDTGNSFSGAAGDEPVIKPLHYWGSWVLLVSGSVLGLGATAVTVAGLWVDSLKEED